VPPAVAARPADVHWQQQQQQKQQKQQQKQKQKQQQEQLRPALPLSRRRLAPQVANELESQGLKLVKLKRGEYGGPKTLTKYAAMLSVPYQVRARRVVLSRPSGPAARRARAPAQKRPLGRRCAATPASWPPAAPPGPGALHCREPAEPSRPKADPSRSSAQPSRGPCCMHTPLPCRPR
jgi:hypothetical protein